MAQNLDTLLGILEDHKVFLTLDGEDLVLNYTSDSIEGEVIMAIKNNKADLVSYLKKYQFSENFEAIPSVEKRSSYPISDAQRRLWILSQFDDALAAYNISFSLTLKIEDKTLFEQALLHVIDRFEILRTVFKKNENGKVHQFILKSDAFNFEIDHKDVSEEDNYIEAARNYIEADKKIGFDLEDGLLLRASLLHIEKQKYIFHFTMHHIISDGWSLQILAQAVMEAYGQLLKKQNIVSDKLPIQYKDYVSWRNNESKKNHYGKSQQYWINKLKLPIPILDLPNQKLRPKIKTYRGLTIKHTFTKRFNESLNRYVIKQGATLFMGLMAGLNALFYRYTNQTDIILGTAIAGRDHHQLEKQIGLFLNTLAIRTQFDTSVCFEELLEIQKNTLIEAYKHQKYPFDTLINELKYANDTSRSPLYDVMVILQSQDASSVAENKLINSLGVEKFETKNTHSQFDLDFSFIEADKALSVSVNYNTDIYSEQFVQQLINHYEYLVLNALDAPNEPIASLPLVTSEEKRKISTLNDSLEEATKLNALVLDMIQEVVMMAPDTTAISFHDKTMSYKELDARSSQFASYLYNEHGIGVNDKVAVVLERTENLIVTLVAILKTGAAYVPIDPDFPKEHTAYIIENSNSKLTINATFLENFRKINYNKELKGITIRPTDLMYVIYTSGSTGKPKGVMVEHRNVASFFRSALKDLQFEGKKTIAATTNVVFDISVLEIFGGLCTGKEIVLFSNSEMLSPKSFIDKLQKKHVEILQITPSRFNQIADTLQTIALPALKTLLVGGERFPEILHENLNTFPGVQVINVYGPTETTIWSTFALITEDKKVTIGKPFENEHVYILSEHLKIQPNWVIGELCISGDGVTRGYMKNPSLSNTHFIDFSSEGSQKLYKTGDLARTLPDGRIDLVGRKDNQVKYNGYRIELGAIEAFLRLKPNIKNVHISILQEPINQSQLLAYIVSDEVQELSGLRNFIANKMPNYMMPSHFIQVDSLPLNSNGKIDSKKLPSLDSAMVMTETFIAPKTDIEKQVAAIWREILGVNRISIYENFMQMGGQSIKAVKMIHQVNQMFQVEVDITKFYQLPNIYELSVEIENLRWRDIKLDESDIIDKISI